MPLDDVGDLLEGFGLAAMVAIIQSHQRPLSPRNSAGVRSHFRGFCRAFIN
jgi:hypothetical protein